MFALWVPRAHPNNQTEGPSLSGPTPGHKIRGPFCVFCSCKKSNLISHLMSRVGTLVLVHATLTCAFLSPLPIPTECLDKCSVSCSWGLYRLPHSCRSVAETQKLRKKSILAVHSKNQNAEEEERFVLSKSPFIGRFLPENDVVTFEAEMEALDKLEEKDLVLQQLPDLHERYDASPRNQDISTRGTATMKWSRRSASARKRWADPEYRNAILEKRVQSRGATTAAAAVSSQYPPSSLHSILRRRCRRFTVSSLHSILHSILLQCGP